MIAIGIIHSPHLLLVQRPCQIALASCDDHERHIHFLLSFPVASLASIIFLCLQSLEFQSIGGARSDLSLSLPLSLSRALLLFFFFFASGGLDPTIQIGPEECVSR